MHCINQIVLVFIFQAVIRLSTGKLKKDCYTLKAKTYEVKDSKQNRKFIQAEKRLVRIEEMNEAADRVEKIDFKLQSDKKQGLYELHN